MHKTSNATNIIDELSKKIFNLLIFTFGVLELLTSRSAVDIVGKGVDDLFNKS